MIQKVTHALTSLCLKLKENKTQFGSHQSVLFFPPFSFFCQIPQGGYRRVQACQFGTVSMMCYLLEGTVAHGGRSSEHVKGGSKQFCVPLTSLSPTCIRFSTALNPHQQDLSLQCKFTAFLSVQRWYRAGESGCNTEIFHRRFHGLEIDDRKDDFISDLLMICTDCDSEVKICSKYQQRQHI